MGKFNFLIIFCLFVSATFAQSQVQTYARTILDTLCGPEMDGRAYINDGERKAAEFIAAEFRSLGLSYFGDNYFQDFRIQVNTFPGEIMLMAGKQVLKPGEDFLVDADAPTVKGNYPIIPLTREMIEDQVKFSIALMQTPENILLIDESEFDMAKKEDRELFAELTAFLKCYDTPHQQTRGIILLTENELKWSPSPIQCFRPLFRVKKEKFPEKVKKASFEIESVFHEGQKSQNVIGFVEGKSHPDSLIVITAHYDHLGKLGKDVYFPGANDNASGVAMLLNLAAYYQQPGNQPEKSIVFMAFGAEEIGLRGSYFFTQNPLFPLPNINFLINLDILGTGDDGIQVVNGKIFRHEFDLLSNLNSQEALLKDVKIRGEMCKSDHCFFHENGVPNFYIYTLGGVAHYHDIYDHPDTLPLTEFEDLMQLLVAFISSLNQAEN